MYQFGKASLRNLRTCDMEIIAVLKKTLEKGLIDFSITEGYRDKARQNRLYDLGKSKVRWPDGKHNSLPSLAVDCVPWINGKSSYKKEHCIFLAGVIMASAKELDVEIRWGGNWDQDGEPVTDQDFQDLIHYEVIK